GVEIPREECLVAVERVIHLPEPLMLGAVVRDAVLKTAARIGGHRHVLEEIQRNAAQPRRIDSIAASGERPDERDRAAAVAARRRDLGEIAVQHGLGGNETGGGRGIASLDPALITAEEEHPVPDDRRTEGTAKLIPVQAVARGRKEVTRVEAPVPQELE